MSPGLSGITLFAASVTVFAEAFPPWEGPPRPTKVPINSSILVGRHDEAADTVYLAQLVHEPLILVQASATISKR
jgi:hypothetical protein